MTIAKIRLKNYRSFRREEILLNNGRNIFIGENGTGKSSILSAISYVVSGSFSTIEKIGFQSLFNVDTIYEYLNSDKDFQLLPKLFIELYLEDNTEVDNFELNGKHNSEGINGSGLKMIISPNEVYLKEIEDALDSSDTFPFEYYKLEFQTFAGVNYTGYSRKHKFRYDLLDTSLFNTQHAMKKYVNKLLTSQTDIDKRRRINLMFRQQSDEFSKNLYSDPSILLDADHEYKIMIEASGENSFLEKITAQKDKIDIRDYGQGQKVMLSAELAFTAAESQDDIVLIEEPENHLSFLNMHKLIKKIEDVGNLQSFITTHSNMIASRLDLKNVILLSTGESVKLEDLSRDTSYFFQKAPDTNVLNFILSKKAILVEGDAEYILMEKFFSMLTEKAPDEMDIAIISCNGKTFKRYLELAKILNKKVVVITDNDEDYQKNVEENYSDYSSFDNIDIKADRNNNIRTLEVALYNDNTSYLEGKLESPQMTNGVQEFMLKNKSESAFRLLNILESDTDDFKIPDYISEAIEWIKE